MFFRNALPETEKTNPVVATADPAFHAFSHPIYVEANDRMNNLKKELTQLNRDIDVAHADHYNESLVNRAAEAANALALGQEPPPVQTRVDIQALYNRRNLVVHALEIAEKNRIEAQHRASVPVMQKVPALYKPIALRAIKAARELVEASEAEEAFCSNLVNNGTMFCGFGRVPMPLTRGHLDMMRNHFNEVFGHAPEDKA